ncbi:hypothetical protein AX16_010916 [Volvariella volvacea WC 439]|nr:hypothetical protein AX16_010916 [Volvariella volvacea WC 439]
MNQYINNPEAVATAVTQIHNWIRESPANWDQVLNHFAVLHAQGDPLHIAAFTLLTSSEIIDNLWEGSSNLSRVVESMHQAVQYLNQAAEDNLATMTLLTYPLARSGIHINNDHLTRSSMVTTITILATSGGSPSNIVSRRQQSSNELRESTPGSPIHSNGPGRNSSHTDGNHNPRLTPIPTTRNATHITSNDTQARNHQHHSPTTPNITPSIYRLLRLKRMEWTRDPKRNTSWSSTCAFGATANVYISSTDGKSTPTTNDKSFVNNDPSLVNDWPLYHPDHSHSLTPSGEPPVTYPASTSTMTKLCGGATGRQMNGIPALKDYLMHSDFSATAGPEDFEARTAL